MARRRREAPAHEAIKDPQPGTPAGGVVEPPDQLGRVLAGEQRQIDRASRQLAHRQAEEAPRAERREIDLQAVRRPQRRDVGIAVVEAGDEARVDCAGIAGAAEADPERRSEVDDQRYDRGRDLALAQHPGRPLDVAGIAHHRVGEVGRGPRLRELEAPLGTAIDRDWHDAPT